MCSSEQQQPKAGEGNSVLARRPGFQYLKGRLVKTSLSDSVKRREEDERAMRVDI